MRRKAWRPFLTWGLVIFFGSAGLLNFLVPGPLRADYMRWGYPGWFHYATGTLEWLSAVLLARCGTRRVGAALGSLLMGAAIVTVLVHREWMHALFPALTFAFLILELVED